MIQIQLSIKYKNYF